MSEKFVLAGLTTVPALLEAGSGRLEALARRQPPFGSELIKSLAMLPVLQLEAADNGDYSQDRCRMQITLRLTNADSVVPRAGDAIVVVVKDAKGRLLYSQKILCAATVAWKDDGVAVCHTLSPTSAGCAG